jgi:hypothetical protein
VALVLYTNYLHSHLVQMLRNINANPGHIQKFRTEADAKDEPELASGDKRG